MENKKEIYENFKKWLDNLNTEEYWEDFDINYKEELKAKDVDLDSFKSSLELKKYLQDLINFFKIEALWNQIAKAIWVNYCKEISKTFHEKIDNLILSWYEWNDIYEDFLKSQNR